MLINFKGKIILAIQFLENKKTSAQFLKRQFDLCIKIVISH